jgi:hypothetical protein
MEPETTASSRRVGDPQQRRSPRGNGEEARPGADPLTPAAEATAPGADDAAGMTPVADQASAAPRHLQHKLPRIGEAQLAAKRGRATLT